MKETKEYLIDKTSKEVVDILNIKDKSKSNVKALFVTLRVLLELLSLKEKYPILNLYGNWVAHTSLNRGGVIIEIFYQLTLAFIACNEIVQKDSDNTSSFNAYVVDAVNPELLRKEIVDFLSNETKIEGFVPLDQEWLILFKLLVQTIENRPLQLPELSKKCRDAKLREKYDFIKTYQDKIGRFAGVNYFSFTLGGRCEASAFFSFDAIAWKIERFDGFTHVGEFSKHL